MGRAPVANFRVTKNTTRDTGVAGLQTKAAWKDRIEIHGH